MTVNPLPPQAYTKETLQKAYTWLLSQSPSVKDMATTQDILVSMYLKAQRSGDASLETPSIQNFKQELKSLASMIGDLQTQPSQPNISTSYSTPLPTFNQASQPSMPMPQKSHSMPQSFVSNSSSGSSTPNGLSGGLGGLDDQSKLAILEVKALLNLSSDTEALRALISLGYKHFKKINS